MSLQDRFTDAKFSVPSSADSVVRSSLLKKIQDFHEKSGEIIFVLGPAGYGKSLLMAQLHEFYSTNFSEAAWLSLHEDDNDIEQFLPCLIKALSRFSPDGFDELLIKVNGENKIDHRKVVSLLVNTIKSLDGKFAILIDDYSFISERNIHELMQLFIKLRPDNLFLCISSRFELPFRVARLMAAKRLLSLEVNDLRFNEQETSELLRLSVGLELSDKNLQLFCEKTEGWPAIMQLAAIALPAANDIGGFLKSLSAKKGSIADFLVEEIVDVMSDDIIDFLMRLSVCERICQSLCEAVTLDKNFSSRLNEQDGIRFLFHSIDNDGEWLVLNPLFRQFLLSKLQENDASLVTELHRRASEWYEENGFIAEAALHAINAGEQSRAFELLEERGLLLATQGHLTSLMNLMNKFPKEMLHKSQELLIQLCWLFVLANKGLEAKRLLGQLQSIIQELQDTPLHVMAEAKTIEATLHIFGEEQARCQVILSEWINKAPESPPHILAVLHADQALVYFDEYRFDEVLEEFRFVTTFDDSSDTITTRTYISSVRALVLMERSRYKQAQVCYQNLLVWLEDVVSPTSQLIALIKGQMSTVFYQQGEFESAWKFAQSGGDDLRSFGTFALFAPAVTAYSRMLQCRGENDKVLESLHVFDSLAKRRKWLRMEVLVAHEFIRFYINLGEQEKAEFLYKKWVEKASTLLTGKSPQMAQCREWLRFSEARLAIENKAYPEAAVILKNLIEEFRTQHRTFRCIESLVLLAKSYMLCNQIERAHEILIEALTLDAENSLIQVYRDEGEPVMLSLKGIMKGLKTSDKSAAHMLMRKQIMQILATDDIVEAERSSPKETPNVPDLAPVKLMEPLTKKELQTLQQLLEGLSNKEIAEKLYVSPNTVKTHLQAAYFKLGVSSRVQAVRRFKELGLAE